MDASSKKETRGSEPNLKNTLHCPRKVASDTTAGGSLAVSNRVSRHPPQRPHPSNNTEEMRAGNFLQLSIINKGKRTFFIFPAGWNKRGWEHKIFKKNQ